MSSNRSKFYKECPNAKYGATQRGNKRHRDKLLQEEDDDYQPPSKTSRRSNRDPHQDEESSEEEEMEEEEAPSSRGKAVRTIRRQRKRPTSSHLEDDDGADVPAFTRTKRSRADVGTGDNVQEEVEEEHRVEDEVMSEEDGGERGQVGDVGDGGVDIGDGGVDIGGGQDEGIGDAEAQGIFNQSQQEMKRRRIAKIATNNGMSATALKKMLEKNPAAKSSFFATRGTLVIILF